MPPVTESTEARPLTDAERKTLAELIARDSAFAAPATRVGESYVALVNLSVPRRGDTKDKQTDLVYAGETVYLTREEAEQFNRKGARDGRQVEVVRKLSGADGTRELPSRVVPNGAFLPPRAVSGRLFRPVMPPPGSDAPRPDPEGASRVQVIDDGNAPESMGSVGAEPQEMADVLSAPAQDAVDLPPSHARQRQGRR